MSTHNIIPQKEKDRLDESYNRYIRAMEHDTVSVVLSIGNGYFTEAYGDDAKYIAHTFGYPLKTRIYDTESVPYVSIPNICVGTLIKRMRDDVRSVTCIRPDGTVTEYSAIIPRQTKTPRDNR